MFDHIPPQVRWSFAGIFGILVVASVIVFFMSRGRDRSAGPSELQQRVRTWWIMASIFALAMVFSRTISLVFFAFVSFLAFKEYLSLIPTRRADRRAIFWAYLAIPLQYYWVGREWYGMFIVFIPVYMFLFLPMRMILIGETKDFLRAVGTLHWGLMTTVFSISHLALLLVLNPERNPNGGGAALVLYLVFLTQFNDVAQYVWGKSFGKHKVVPTVSPKKTVEGLVGGVLTTMLLGWLLGPLLTPLSPLHSLTAGLLIGLSGFVGDVTISALKRDLQVKDSGTLLPGHGGMLDRIDSLTFTAPLFFHYFYYLSK